MTIPYTPEKIAPANNIEIAYDTFGNPAHPALLLVGGLSNQLIVWDADFCTQLAEHDLYVIRYDNRDVGHSTKFEAAGMPNIPAIMAARAAGQQAEAPYYLKDMAADGIALLDALNIDQAHVMGISMGGMIVQEMAINFPKRLLSLISVMSTTGEPIEPATPDAMVFLTAPSPTDRDGYLDHTVKGRHILHGNALPYDTERSRRKAAEQYDRVFYPVGVARQMAAIMASEPRHEKLKAVTVPSLVMHGSEDPLVRPDGGHKTAAAIPNATLHIVDGMGHNLPLAKWPEIISTVVEHIKG